MNARLLRRRNGFSAGTHARLRCAIVAGSVLLLGLGAASVRADTFRCVGPDGGVTFSDKGCPVPKGNESPPLPKSSTMPGDAATSTRAPSGKEKLAAHILDAIRIAPVEPEELQLRRTVDDAAPDLVKAIDPENRLWTPANGRWRSVSDFVKADLRGDVGAALQSSTARISRTSASMYAARSNDADLTALSAFLNSPDGARYVAIQSAIRPLLYSALTAIEAQEPMTENVATDDVLAQRRQFLRLALEYQIARNVPASLTSELQPGSDTVLENAIRREGNTVDTLMYEYGSALSSIQSFTDSDMAKRFFAAVEPAMLNQLWMSSVVTTDFAEQEFDKYLLRWRGYYGPMRTSTSTTVVIRGRTVLVVNAMTTRIRPGVQSPEAMAIQCEQRDGAIYQATHRTADAHAMAAGLRDVQNRCRAEQRLPPL
jgi:hypothetical protein